MKGRAFVLLTLALLLAATALLHYPKLLTIDNVLAVQVLEATKHQVAENYGKLPLSFEENQGQTDSQVQFLSRGNGYTLFLNSTEAVLRIPSRPRQANSSRESLPRAKSRGEGAVNIPEERQPDPVLRMQLVGANPHPEASGLDELPGKSNYFIGNDPERWRTKVSNYAKVEYRNVYPGVDLVYYGNQRQLEYDFVVAPGADATAIVLHFDGADKLEVDSRGDLVLHIAEEQVRMRRPLVYQEADGVRQEVDGGYLLREDNQVSFRVSSYDARKPLVIDPVLVYSTFLGGGGFDSGFAIAVDASGNAFVTGLADSLDFPTGNPFQPAFGGGLNDVFVTKLNPTGSALVYSTFLGGIGDDQGRAIAVDSSGNAYVAGQSDSIDFPTANPFQGAYGGGTTDVFVTKLNASGNALLFSTYLGGSSQDRAFDIALDSGGNAYVTGLTNSADYPTANSIFPALSGGFDAFVSKLNASGDALVYSTYLGGSDLDHAWGITVDSSGNAYVAGDTHSANFPTANSFQPAFGGGTEDAFVTKLNASGSALVYSTHFGGSGDEVANTIAVDSSGNAYITGETSSIDLPTVNPFQAAPRGMLDIFVTKLDATGSSLVYSTYLGGNFVEISFGIAVDSEGNAYVTGGTNSPNFPSANPLQPHLGSVDAFVTKLNAAGNELVYSTHLGGVGFDQGLGIAVDSSGNAYVAGDTDSVNFPTASPFQPALGGLVNALIAKIMDLTPGLPSPVLPLNSVVNGASFRPAAESNGDIAPGAMVAIFGTDLASSTQVATAVPLPTMLVDTSVTFDNIPAPLFFVSNTQINAQVPFELPPGPVTVRVKRGDASAAQLVTVAPFSPGIFTVNSEGTGPGAVLHADTFQLVNESNPARPGEFLSLFATGLGRLRSAVTSGEITPTPPPETLSLPQANIAGIPATVSFSGLAPGFVGLYQVNLQVPESISPGTHLLQVIINGVPSNTVTIAVE